VVQSNRILRVFNYIIYFSVVLKMEEYKANFEEERRDRVSMKERKDELAEELTRLKLELEGKTAELESLHRAHLQLAKDHVDRYNY